MRREEENKSLYQYIHRFIGLRRYTWDNNSQIILASDNGGNGSTAFPVVAMIKAEAVLSSQRCETSSTLGTIGWFGMVCIGS